MTAKQPLSAQPSAAEYVRAAFSASVYDVAQVTPLQLMPKLSARLGNTISVKREDRQPVHSFKLRGAYAMIAELTEEQKRRGGGTASAGKPAQGGGPSAGETGGETPIVGPVGAGGFGGGPRAAVSLRFPGGRGAPARAAGGGKATPPGRETVSPPRRRDESRPVCRPQPAARGGC